LFQAVQDAYRGLLMSGRYPVAFLFLEVPPDQVDVNVHPTKAEVRFRDKETIYQLVQNTVRKCLQEADLTARMQLKGKKERLTDPGNAQPLARSAESVAAVPDQPGRLSSPKPAQMSAAARSTPPVPGGHNSPGPQAGTTVPITSSVPSHSSVTPAPLFTPAQETQQPATPLVRQVEQSTSAPLQMVGALKAMQVLDCYLVVEVPPDEVLFIDQHALHERILFEELQERIRSGTLEIQHLLIPETITLPAAQTAVVLEQWDALAELGLLVEDFGGGTILLSGFPALLGKRSPKAVLQAVVDHMVGKERMPSREQLLNDLLSLMACHSAVRAGDRLTTEEIASLLAQRELAQDSPHCPNGRPTSLRFNRQELERLFKRV